MEGIIEKNVIRNNDSNSQKKIIEAELKEIKGGANKVLELQKFFSDKSKRIPIKNRVVVTSFYDIRIKAQEPEILYDLFIEGKIFGNAHDKERKIVVDTLINEYQKEERLHIKEEIKKYLKAIENTEIYIGDINNGGPFAKKVKNYFLDVTNEVLNDVTIENNHSEEQLESLQNATSEIVENIKQQEIEILSNGLEKADNEITETVQKKGFFSGIFSWIFGK